MNNLYDEIQIDIENAHKEINDTNSCRGNLYLCFPLVDKVLYKMKLYPKLVDAGFLRRWFDEFCEYWQVALKGRPLALHDFFYLYSHYRSKFQAIAIKDNPTKEEFLETWQKDENIYLVFNSVYHYALHPFSHFSFLSYLNKKIGGDILEYGCGIAPITTSMLRCGLSRYSFTIADLRCHTFHYAKFFLKGYRVSSFDLIPFEAPAFEKKFDIIFLVTVLEHLPNPLEVIKFLTQSLKRDGFLIFDYMLNEGKGLDTLEAVEQRKVTLDFVKENFKIVKGQLAYDDSMGITIARKQLFD